MLFHSWLQNLRSTFAPNRGQRHHARRGSLRHATHRLNLEILEDRRMLSTFTVLNPVDSGADSLRSAIVAANGNPGSPPAFPFDAGIVYAGAVTPPQAAVWPSSIAILIGPRQAGGHSPVDFKPVVIAPETGPRTVAGGDVDGDGIPDIIVGAQVPNGHVRGRPFANDHEGGFVPPGLVLGRKAGEDQQEYGNPPLPPPLPPLPPPPVKFAVGIVRAGTVMPPQAQATLHSPVGFHPVVVTPEIGPPTVASGDVNDDGPADIITGAGPGAPGGHVKVE